MSRAEAILWLGLALLLLGVALGYAWADYRAERPARFDDQGIDRLP